MRASPQGGAGGVHADSRAGGTSRRPTRSRSSTLLQFGLFLFGVIVFLQFLVSTVHYGYGSSRNRIATAARVGYKQQSQKILRSMLAPEQPARLAQGPVEVWREFMATAEAALKAARLQPLAVLEDAAAADRSGEEAMLASTKAHEEAHLCSESGWSPDIGAQRSSKGVTLIRE
eukprot:CAMPEP_0174921968 /NCGR_PEP_ID=MMETSP1355-20121228/5533_1 /TAXON_ID=464990 /ORGANISM="Hemiselmis tepida, Strain CCMP443" /LENGTH=173 /DNA_ID=CAMNT_0016167511 /DNA_START=197 /DNA_END=715 /DNA_ORIENTATION=-